MNYINPRFTKILAALTIMVSIIMLYCLHQVFSDYLASAIVFAPWWFCLTLFCIKKITKGE